MLSVSQGKSRKFIQVYSCSNVESISSACVNSKTLCLSKEYHMDGTGSPERNIYLSGTHVTVDSI